MTDHAIKSAMRDLMALCGLYVRKRTLYTHQREAMTALSFESDVEAAETRIERMLNSSPSS